jgi:hypothetical protein
MNGSPSIVVSISSLVVPHPSESQAQPTDVDENDLP